VNGVRQGQGEFKSASAHYTGEWAADNANGKGKLVVGSTSYTGTFDEGQFVAGECVSADGAVHSAQQFVNFQFIEGKGTVRYADGSLFAGTFKVGVREGEGRHEYPDGSSLQGVWKHDLPNGVMAWQGGAGQWLKSYTGTYVDGRPQAKQAEASFSDGSRFVGSFKNGLADRGELTLADGSVLVGKFRSGQWLTGKSTYTITEADELFEGVPDAHLRIPAKGRFMAVPLPVTRPSFPLNIAQGALPKSAAGASTGATLSPGSNSSGSSSPGARNSGNGKVTPRK
jgi:hypothetical protein